jgi:hypothetical protein
MRFWNLDGKPKVVYEFLIPRIIKICEQYGCFYKFDYAGGICSKGSKNAPIDMVRVESLANDNKYSEIDSYIKDIARTVGI